jgi:tRNA dimethylallyltransferase
MVSPIIIAGPTASGKSVLAMQIAKQVGGELICADSRQVYAQMSVGTAGPTLEDLSAVPHHGFAKIDPDQTYDAGQFVKDTGAYVTEVLTRKRVPILVGGTGLYLRAFRYGLSDVPARDDHIRGQIIATSEQLGWQKLHEQLAEIDSDAAKKIAATDQVRILRALEIWHLTRQQPSVLRKSHFVQTPRLEAQWLLIYPEKEWLWDRLLARVKHMFDNGLIEEALALRERLKVRVGLLKTMGYEEALLWADGLLSKEDAIMQTSIRHRQYARRQLTWFKKETWWRRLDPTKSFNFF